MLVNVEQQYNDFIRNRWLKLSDVTKDIIKFHQKPNPTYNIMSLRSIRFLKAMLRNLDNKK